MMRLNELRVLAPACGKPDVVTLKTLADVVANRRLATRKLGVEYLQLDGTVRDVQGFVASLQEVSRVRELEIHAVKVVGETLDGFWSILEIPSDSGFLCPAAGAGLRHVPGAGGAAAELGVRGTLARVVPGRCVRGRQRLTVRVTGSTPT